MPSLVADANTWTGAALGVFVGAAALYAYNTYVGGSSSTVSLESLGKVEPEKALKVDVSVATVSAVFTKETNEDGKDKWTKKPEPTEEAQKPAFKKAQTTYENEARTKTVEQLTKKVAEFNRVQDETMTGAQAEALLGADNAEVKALFSDTAVPNGSNENEQRWVKKTALKDVVGTNDAAKSNVNKAREALKKALKDKINSN